MSYVYSGIRAYLRPRLRMFFTDSEPTARRFRGKGSYLYAFQEVSNWGGSNPCGTPEGPLVEPQF